MKIEAVKVQRLYLKVAEQLSTQINDGTLEAGQRLPSERDLASLFGVSRPTIREAMIALEVACLVEVRSGSGVYVLPQKIDLSDLKQQDDPGPIEILEARLFVESEAAGLAATRITDEQLSELDEAMASLAAASSATKEQCDRRFHLIIADASGNSALASTITWLWDLRDQSVVSQFFHERLRSEGIEPVIADHKAVLEAIRSHDANAARTHMYNHLKRVMALVSPDSTTLGIAN